MRTVEKDILTATRPPRLAETPDGAGIWVSCEIAGVVEFIDPRTLTITGKLEFAPHGVRKSEVMPVDIAITRDGKTAWVALGRANRVAEVDVPTHTVRGYVLVGSRPWGLRLTSDEKLLYVTNGLSDDVTVIDTAEREPIRSVPVGRVPYGVLIDDAPVPGEQ